MTDSTPESRLNKTVREQYEELFSLCGRISEAADAQLKALNGRQLKLVDLRPHQRIFLFILTRAVKSYAAICHLCQAGYAQDVSSLLRSLLENLITAKYIIRDPVIADDLTRRFVDYKWIIFKRYLPEEEKIAHGAQSSQMEKFLQKKHLIDGKTFLFKKKYQVSSDRGLLTWSGRTVKDMAGAVGQDMLEEYEATFRLCSRFSHASILGDQEYIVQEDRSLIFSPLPSAIGIIPHMKKTITYFLDFLTAADALFRLERQDDLLNLQAEARDLFAGPKYRVSSEIIQEFPAPAPARDIRESRIVFQIRDT